MQTGQVARQSGVNVQTLRYYERRGLLQAPARRPSGYREYTSHAVGVSKVSSLRAMQGSLRRLVETCEKPRQQRECPLLDALADGDEPAPIGPSR
jgi:DNA-binding transcriptional MerR regulator